MGGGHSASHCFDSSGFASLSSSFSISPPDQVVVTRYSEPKSRARVDLLIIKSLKRGKRESDLLINNLNNHRPLPFTVAAPPVPIAWRENLENFLSILSSLLSLLFFLFSMDYTTSSRFILPSSLSLFITFVSFVTNEIAIIYHPPSCVSRKEACHVPLSRENLIKDLFYRCYGGGFLL